MLLKCCTQYASKFGKFNSGHRTGKGQFAFQSRRRAMPKNVQTTAQLHSFHTASKVMLKILQARLQQYINWELPDVQSGFRKGREIRDQIANIRWTIKKAREFQKKRLFMLYWLCQSFDCVDHNKLWKILKEMGIPDHLTCLLRPVCRSGSNSSNWTWNNRLVPNRKRSTSRLYFVTLFI